MMTIAVHRDQSLLMWWWVVIKRRLNFTKNSIMYNLIYYSVAVPWMWGVLGCRYWDRGCRILYRGQLIWPLLYCCAFLVSHKEIRELTMFPFCSPVFCGSRSSQIHIIGSDKDPNFFPVRPQFRNQFRIGMDPNPFSNWLTWN